MIWVILFWTLLGLIAFAFALAVQMRIMIGVVLARALRAQDKSLSIRQSRLAPVLAGNGDQGVPGPSGMPAAIAHLQATYPVQIKQLRLARRISLVAPAGLVLLVAAWRLYSA